jgi:hypothetical protein
MSSFENPASNMGVKRQPTTSSAIPDKNNLLTDFEDSSSVDSDERYLVR